MNYIIRFPTKAKKMHKSRGVKHEVYSYKRKMATLGTIITLMIIISVTAVVAYYAFSIYFASSQAQDSNSNVPSENPLNAVLVDALYSTLPNDEFTETLSETLQEAGFKLDIYKGNEVDVELMKNLESGYELVILRMHSAIFTTGDLYLFTAEPYTVGKYTLEEEFQLIKKGESGYPPPVFAVNWVFIKRCMPERFNGTLVIAMGCEGSGDTKLINEILSQGALGYIGWNGPVSLDHSDEAALYLLKALYLDKLPIPEAVEETNEQIGADPAHGVTLEAYTT